MPKIAIFMICLFF